MTASAGPGLPRPVWYPADEQTLVLVVSTWAAQAPGAALWAMVPEADAHAVPLLQAICHTHGVVLMGGVFPGLLHNGVFLTQGVCLMPWTDAPPARLVPLDDPTQAPDRLLEAVRSLWAPADWEAGQLPGQLTLVFDGLLPQIATWLDSLHARLPRMPTCVGVNAGSETFTPTPCLFDNHRFLDRAAWVMRWPQPVVSVVHHGYPVSKALLTTTSGVGNRVAEIDGRPAFDVYRDVLAREFGVDLTRDNFYDHAVHFPLGVVTLVDVLVRIPVAVDTEGALICVGEVPPHAVVRVLRAPALPDATTAQVLGKAITDGGHQGPLLLFYCAGRRMHFGADAATELQNLSGIAGLDQVSGALTLGEIDTVNNAYLRSVPRFHNACVVGLA